MRIGTLAWMVLLAGCGVSWDLDRPSDVVEDVIQVLFLRYDVGEPEEVKGPHAVGASITIEARRQGLLGTFDGWTFEVIPADVAELAAVRFSEDDPDRAELVVRFVAEGDGFVQAVNRAGFVAARVAIEARDVASAEFSAYDDLVTRRDEIVGADGRLALAETGAVSLATAWLDDSDGLLTGTGIVGLTVEPGGEAFVGVDEDTLVVQNLDTFTLRGLVAGDTRLDVAAADRVIETLEVVVVPLASIDNVSIDDVSLGRDKPEDGDTIGYVRSTATTAGRRVLGAPLAWTADGIDIGSGSYGIIREAEGQSTAVEVCVPGTAICDSRTVQGRVDVVGDGVAPPCSCDNARSGGAMGALVGLLALFRRRRAAKAA